MRAVGYVRTAALEAASPDLAAANQRREIERVVERAEWTLVRMHEDTGPNAKAGSRPALKALLGGLEGVEKVVVSRLDRLGGSARVLSQIVRRLGDAGVGLVAVEEDLDTDLPGGRALPAVLRLAARWEPTSRAISEGWQLESLRSFAFAPRTVIDVGAADGTLALYELFRDARHVMIEPLEEFADDLAALARRHRGEYIPTAVGRKQGAIQIRVDPDNLLMSSALKTVASRRRLREREVPVTTLDELLEERGWEPPFGLKLDAEGYEDQVIEGAGCLLERTEFVIAEVSLSPRFEGSPSSADLIALLRGRGFQVLDVLAAERSPLGVHADLLFGNASLGTS